ncbi:MAG: (2Fe-2S)-binding protein [Acidobacteria bacterium]|nr:MAG: (2Fe-2S)-binding protein [Acidobacteriota bacterium]
MSGKKDKHECQCQTGVTRRGFLSSVGTGAVVASAAGQVQAAPGSSPVLITGETVPVKLLINGREHRLLVEPRWSLLFVLREKLGLTGTKMGCGQGECGACTVLVNDEPRYACLTLAVEAEGFKVTTVEGLMNGEELGPVQQAFVEHDAFQCGYCTPGQVMAAEGLLRSNPTPNAAQIQAGMSGNLCRCGAYAHIFPAVAKAAELRRKGGQS